MRPLSGESGLLSHTLSTNKPSSQIPLPRKLGGDCPVSAHTYRLQTSSFWAEPGFPCAWSIRMEVVKMWST